MLPARMRNMSGRGAVIAVTSLALEARVALGPGVAVICKQASQLAGALEGAVKGGAAGIISFGIAGGLAPNLAAGNWVIGSAVRTDDGYFPTDRHWAVRLLNALPGAVYAEIAGTDAPAASSRDKRRLHARTGAALVDMESHIAACIAASHRIPFAVCRVVIDAVERDLPPAAVIELRPDGTPDLLAILRSVAREPSQLPTLARTALDARIAVTALRRGRRLLDAGLGCPYFSLPDIPASAAALVGGDLWGALRRM
jgi:adenosylhomocysteine nucleosidase